MGDTHRGCGECLCWGVCVGMGIQMFGPAGGRGVVLGPNAPPPVGPSAPLVILFWGCEEGEREQCHRK